MIKQIKYVGHNWVICVDLKTLNFLLGQESGYKKFQCFAYRTVELKINIMSERTDKLRTKLMPGDKNVIASPLVLIDKIIFSPLYIKPGITKQLAKVSDKKGKCFEY